MHEIIATDIVGRLGPVLINPFVESGEFRPIKSIAEEILAWHGPSHELEICSSLHKNMAPNIVTF